MRRFLIWSALTAICLSCSIAYADRPILLVTPKGVFQADVTDGVPGQFRPVPYDVIVQGFGGGGGTTPIPPDPKPPEADPLVQQVAAISKTVLKDSAEAKAMAAIIDSLSSNGLKGDSFKEALELTIPIADSSLNAGGRLINWVKQALAVTTDADKLKAGLQAAFSLSAVELQQIAQAVKTGDVPTGAAIDFTKIIEIITMIIALLKQLGII